MTLAFGMSVSSFAEDRPGKIELEGVIQELPSTGLIGIWMVSEKKVVVTDATVIKEDDRTVKVGVNVEVEGSLEPDGSIKARKIETED
jgi:hypothetical protein